jgi:LuxR family maltose regulon positive regulatory protein
MALEHLLNTSEHERCAHLLTELVLPNYSVGQMSTVARWLSALGDPSIVAYPPLAVLAGWVAVLTGQTGEAQRWAAIVDDASFDAVPLDGSASFESARAMLHAVICAGGPEQMLTDANFAVDAEPPWSPWRDTALVLQAEALLLAGDVDHAITVFEEASTIGASLGNTDTVVDSESELAFYAMDRGRWADAAQHVDAALATIDEHRLDDYPTSVLAFAAAARLALHDGNLRETERQLTRAMRARPSCTFVIPWLAVRVRLHLAKVYLAMADQATARHLLREIDDILLHAPLGALGDDVEGLRTLFTSASPTAATAASPLSPAELRLLPYLQTHLTFREIGERLFVSRNTISSEVGSIYRKLGVSSRSDAVHQATAIGLLGA